MSTTLSYGYKKPVTGDSGSTFFPDLEDDIQQLNDHSHNGIDSALIDSSNIGKFTATITAAGWTLVANGIYRQSVTVPNSKSYNDFQPLFRDLNTGHIYNLTVEKINNTSYYVYINDNTVDLTVFYVS